MSVEKFIEVEGNKGDLVSSGRFTLDLRGAASKMKRFQLPSENHLLLKLLQLAALLGADKVEIRLAFRESRVSFSGPGERLPDFHSSVRAVAEPHSLEDIVGRFVASLFLFGVHTNVRELSWRMFQAEACQTVRLLPQGRIDLSGGSLPKGEVRHDIRLVHPVGWRFWEGARRRRKARELLDDFTRFSRLRIKLDGRDFTPSPAAVLNDHVSDYGGSQFNAATGVMQNTRGGPWLPVICSFAYAGRVNRV